MGMGSYTDRLYFFRSHKYRVKFSNGEIETGNENN